ncbi:modifier of mdg4-like isoform X6 [Cylas formicarius]|uniref:modifier of mdg4-like isoform X6 n=1 Tax=Cylas formicarius TaxID=197179 RepID=UPI0029588898|nr:modifier of mdg4-like isoform X6 [Cylas formicarius]
MASEQFSLCWDNFHKNMSSGMNSLLENEDLVDVTLAVEGKCLKAHKMVLSVCSPYFKELFKSNPCQHPIVFMKDVSYVAISDLLQFMYQGEVQVSQENLTTFIKTAEALQIKGLTGDGNGSVDNDESVHEKSTPAPEDTYKPVPRPKKQPPTPVVSSTPAPKRQRLSDSQPTPSAVVTKTEPVNSSSAETPPVQFKVEPYDQNQTLTIPDDDGDNFGDDTLDDNTADDTEDYSMMEGEEPQAGTSTDGAGEGQDASNGLRQVLKTNKRPGRPPKKLRRQKKPDSSPSSDEGDGWEKNQDPIAKELVTDENLKEGRFILVQFLSGTKKTVRYVYLCVIQEIIRNSCAEPDVKVMALHCVNTKTKNTFISCNNDISDVSKDDVLYVLPIPKIEMTGERIRYVFDRSIDEIFQK